eukprot:GGOE01016806.1.p2 GENE.GGOE01016806.1~~GGOE01016806.1.p2  ORF type:complete len:121 (+),score=7.41 GGOE01016806.1:708-1070(+)
MIHAWHLDRRQVPTRCLREPSRRFWFARLRVTESRPFAADLRISSYYAGQPVCRNDAKMSQQLAKRAVQLMCNGCRELCRRFWVLSTLHIVAISPQFVSNVLDLSLLHVAITPLWLFNFF